MGWRILCWILDSPLMTKINWVFPKCFHWICWQNICHRATFWPGCYNSTSKTHVRDRIFKLSPIHASVIYQIPWIRWIQWIPVPFRKNSIVGLKSFWNFQHSLGLKFRTTAVVPNNSSAVSFTAFCLRNAWVCKWEYPPYLWNPNIPKSPNQGQQRGQKKNIPSKFVWTGSTNLETCWWVFLSIFSLTSVSEKIFKKRKIKDYRFKSLRERQGKNLKNVTQIMIQWIRWLF